jgi:hypothetical protein
VRISRNSRKTRSIRSILCEVAGIHRPAPRANRAQLRPW